jgi:glycosyltransferase involved in cell wall biosynthesis
VNELYMADWVAGVRPDLVLHTALFDYDALVPAYGPARPRTAGVLYDLIPLLFPDRYHMDKPGNEWYAERFRGSLTTMDTLLAISEASAVDMRRLAGPGCPEVVNIRGAADESFRTSAAGQRAADRAVRAKFGLTRPFILFVGGMDWRKNMEGSIAGYAALPAGVRVGCDLAVVCKVSEHERAHLRREAERHGVADQVRLTGFVADDELLALYRGCRVFFFPSLYEGLGLPILEAMACGAPVVTASNSSLPEYAGPLSWYCDPDDPLSMAAALQAALDEPRAEREAERVRFAGSFTWTDTARRAAEAIEAVGRVPAAPARNPRIAWVSPVPPAETGIADYTADILPHVADRFDIDVVVDPRSPVAPEIARRFPVIAANEVAARDRARRYDLFVYHAGNSSFHTYQLPLMVRHPGAVVLHDFFLGGLMRTARDERVTYLDPVDELDAQGESVLAEWARFGWANPVAATELAPLNQRVLDAAGYVIVHSAWSWNRVRRAASAPVALVPMAVPDEGPLDRRAERERLGIAAGEFVVASLGIVAATKRIGSVIRAAARLPKAVLARTRVLVVGHASEAERHKLGTIAHAAGFTGALEFRGRVPLEDFCAYAVAADVTVQLRYPSRGETSAALVRALAAGATCITSDQGSMAELPPGVALKVRSPAREVEDLTAHLARLAADPGERDRIGAAARAHALTVHSGPAVGMRYAAALRDAAARIAAGDSRWLADAGTALSDLPGGPPTGLIEGWARLRARVAARQAAAPVDRSTVLPFPRPAEPVVREEAA